MMELADDPPLQDRFWYYILLVFYIRMKRTFDRIDSLIPSAVWDKYGTYQQKLQRINEIDEKIDALISHQLRDKFAVHSEPSTKTKILRIFIRHQVIPASPLERAHVILSIEGAILDPKYRSIVPFGRLFESIRFQVDKKLGQDKHADWTAATQPEGKNANCFRVKFYCDRPASTVRIFFERSSDIVARYELSTKLRNLLPLLHVDPTEEDVVLAVWQYVCDNKLLSENVVGGKKVVRCDDVSYIPVSFKKEFQSDESSFVAS